MEVIGRDISRSAYRVAVEMNGARVVGLVPEYLMADPWRPDTPPTHQRSYEWIAAHAQKIENAMVARHNGLARIAPPFDSITLAEET